MTPMTTMLKSMTLSVVFFFLLSIFFFFFCVHGESIETTTMTRTTKGFSNNALGIQRVCQVSMSVPNINASIAWYQANLGFEVAFYQNLPEYGTTLAILTLNETRLEMIEDDSSVGGEFRQDPPKHTRLLGISQFAFQVPDIQATMAILAERNIPTEFYYQNTVLQLYFVFIRDLNGVLLQFIQFY